MKSNYFVLILMALMAIVLATTIQIAADVSASEVVPGTIADTVMDAPSFDIAAAQTTTSTAVITGGQTLQTVLDRGTLRCVVHGTLVGFGYLDPTSGEFSGFDVDFCKAIAAAVLGDAEAVEFVPSDATTRFPLLQSGEGDVLVRNTTWTISRDTSLGFNFAPTTFYDGQGMMVRKDSGVESLEDLEGAAICVEQGTTTEKNLTDVMRALGIDYEPVVFQGQEPTRTAYEEGRCDAFTTDKSGLVASQTQMETPEDHLILEETMSKEPLGPAVRHGDDQWFDIVKWVTYGLFAAEEYGITSANVEEMAETAEDPVLRNLLGAEGDLGVGLGLENDFIVKAVQQMGNYGEIYDRNLGPDTPFNLPRGFNAQYIDGGLIYAPPFR